MSGKKIRAKKRNKSFYFNLEIYEYNNPVRDVKFKNIPLSLLDDAVKNVKKKYG